ncbi:MAG: head GIN domain-containing protein [Eudoraea sp.]|uniref:head GIN domain-containing protein n=1 Tax=Eudoraea sp. TaxID=1979955 RepID=UPI0032651409
MTTLARITIAFILALFLSSCAFDINIGDGKKGNGVVAEDRREVTEEFTVVSAQEGLDVYVTQAKDFEITVEADDNVIDLIGTDIRDGKLKIHAIENIGRATKKVYVSMPDITGLETSSGADLIGKSVIESDKISLNASSGSDLQVELNADEVDANTSSGADIRLSGEANMLYANASSGSDIKARDFTVQTCRADASSGADISVNVSESLTADASSGGDISYSGEATVQMKKSVSGSVHKN